MKTIATEDQVRMRLAESGPFRLYVSKGERAWDPISKRGWTRGAGWINYFAPTDDGFVACGWSRDNGKGSGFDRRHGVSYR